MSGRLRQRNGSQQTDGMMTWHSSPRPPPGLTFQILSAVQEKSGLPAVDEGGEALCSHQTDNTVQTGFFVLQ